MVLFISFFKFCSSLEEWHEITFNNFSPNDHRKSTSKALLWSSPLIYYHVSQFTNLIRSFSASIVNNKVAALTEDAGQLFDFYATFIMHESTEYIDLNELLQKTES